MKPFELTEEAKEKILARAMEEMKKSLDDYSFKTGEQKLTFSTTVSEVLKDKITVMFEPLTYLRMQALVEFYDTELAWYGLIKKINPKLYYVYDVKVMKQTVNGSKVDTEDEDMLEFFDSLTDEEINDLHFQAHSHVNMSTGASGTDIENQLDTVSKIDKKGFYLFQIWNKSGDINTYLYDKEANMLYDRKDIVIEVEAGETTLSDFVASTVDLVSERKTSYYPNYNYLPKETKKGKKKKEESTWLNDYWPGTYVYDE